YLFESSGMAHRRTDAIQPGTLVRCLRRRERRTGQLLGIKTVIHLLRRVTSDRQSTRQRFGLEAVAETGHVAVQQGGGPFLFPVRRSGFADARGRSGGPRDARTGVELACHDVLLCPQGGHYSWSAD